MSKSRSASIRARLKNCADAAKQDFNLTLTHYGLERLLYRLSVSKHAPNFLLKGALLFMLFDPATGGGISSGHRGRRLKGRTSSKLFEEFPHLKKRYWGRHFWARGYFCATVGQMTEEMIKQYLEHHFEPRPNDDFKMEPD